MRQMNMEKSGATRYSCGAVFFCVGRSGMRNLFFMVLVAWFGFAPAAATVIVRQIEPVPKGWQLGLEGSYEDEDGATQKRDYALGFNLSHKAGFREIRAFGGVDYGRVNGVENTDNSMLHLRYIRELFADGVRFEGFTQTENDDFANLSRRDLIGGGVSRFFNSPDGSRRLLAMVGLMREEERHLTDATQDRQVTRITASLQTRWQLPRDNKLYFIAYVQPNLDDMSDDRRITAELSLDIPLSDRLSLTTGYHYRYNDKPFSAVPREQTKLSTGFRFSF